MTLQIILGILLLAALGFAWYTERTRRRKAELEKETTERRTDLDAVEKKLDENKVAYDKANAELGPIPPHMLDLVGASPVVTAPDGKTRVDVTTGERFARAGGIVSEQPGPAVEPVESQRFFDIGGEGKAPTTH